MKGDGDESGVKGRMGKGGGVGEQVEERRSKRSTERSTEGKDRSIRRQLSRSQLSYVKTVLTGVQILLLLLLL